MASNHLFQATCLVLLLLLADFHSGAHGDSPTYCGLDFARAVYRVCSESKRDGGVRFGDVLNMKRFRGVDTTLEDEAFLSGLEKRSEGMGSYCCNHGCTDSELSAVC